MLFSKKYTFSSALFFLFFLLKASPSASAYHLCFEREKDQLFSLPPKKGRKRLVRGYFKRHSPYGIPPSNFLLNHIEGFLPQLPIQMLPWLGYFFGNLDFIHQSYRFFCEDKGMSEGEKKKAISDWGAYFRKFCEEKVGVLRAHGIKFSLFLDFKKNIFYDMKMAEKILIPFLFGDIQKFILLRASSFLIYKRDNRQKSGATDNDLQGQIPLSFADYGIEKAYLGEITIDLFDALLDELRKPIDEKNIALCTTYERGLRNQITHQGPWKDFKTLDLAFCAGKPEAIFLEIAQKIGKLFQCLPKDSEMRLLYHPILIKKIEECMEKNPIKRKQGGILWEHALKKQVQAILLKVQKGDAHGKEAMHLVAAIAQSLKQEALPLCDEDSPTLASDSQEAGVSFEEATDRKEGGCKIL